MLEAGKIVKRNEVNIIKILIMSLEYFKQNKKIRK